MAINNELLDDLLKDYRSLKIQSHLEEMYQVEACPGLLSTVTDAVVDEVGKPGNCQPDEMYSIN